MLGSLVHLHAHMHDSYMYMCIILKGCDNFMCIHTVFSPRIIQGMMGGHGLGVACGHIKAFGLFPFPHQRKLCAEGLQDRCALIKYIGENTGHALTQISFRLLILV